MTWMPGWIVRVPGRVAGWAWPRNRRPAARSPGCPARSQTGPGYARCECRRPQITRPGVEVLLGRVPDSGGWPPRTLAAAMMVQVVERATATQTPAAVETTGGGIGGVLAGLLGKVTVCGHDGSVFEFGPFVDHLECRAVVTPDVQQDLAAGLVQTKRLGQAEDLPRAKVRGVLHRIFVFLN